MKYKKLNQTDINTSVLCLGTMTFGMQNNIQDAFNQLDYATERGINYIDTAELYPSPIIDLNTMYNTERFIGKWLKTNKRTDLVIVSKVMGPTAIGKMQEETRPNPNPLTPDNINKAINDTLTRLNTDYIDVYLIHWPIRSTNFFGKLGYEDNSENFNVNQQILETIKTIDNLIKQGKIRHYGISNETAWGLMKYIQLAEAHGLTKPILIQNPYSLLNRSFEVGCAEVCGRENIGLMSYSTLAHGVLTGKHLNNIEKNSRIDLYSDYFSRYFSEKGIISTKKYTELALDNGISPTTLAISYVLSKSFINCSIIGATTTLQLQDWIDAVDVTLSNDIIQSIKHIHDKHTYPCP